MKLGILKLPEATSAVAGNLFIVETPTSTDSIAFENMTFGLSNATFANVVSAHSDELSFLSTSLNTISSNIDSSFTTLSQTVTNTIRSVFNNFNYVLNPVGAIRFTSTFINPGTLVPNTTWELISQGHFVAGVGTGTDKNSMSYTFVAGTTGNSVGEYGHPLSAAELPAHTHTASLYGETDSSVSGLYTESAPGPGTVQPMAPLTSTTVGNSTPHNNIPPLFGVYIWLRVA